MFEHRHFFSVHVWVVCHSGVMDIVLGLLVGLLGGVIIGWLAHARSSSQAAEKPPAIGPKELNATMTPLHEAMGELAGALRGLEKERTQDMAALKATVHSMARTSTRLSDRTEALVSSLRSPNIRGRWGEVQLQRVVELGGMEEHCDFDTQVSRTVNGHAVRPDMIIRLAGGRSIVVDAKSPLRRVLGRVRKPRSRRTRRTLAQARAPHAPARQHSGSKRLRRSVSPHAGIRRHVRSRRPLPGHRAPV